MSKPMFYQILSFFCSEVLQALTRKSIGGAGVEIFLGNKFGWPTVLFVNLAPLEGRRQCILPAESVINPTN